MTAEAFMEPLNSLILNNLRSCDGTCSARQRGYRHAFNQRATGTLRTAVDKKKQPAEI
jgi:hypothetical protein